MSRRFSLTCASLATLAALAACGGGGGGAAAPVGPTSGTESLSTSVVTNSAPTGGSTGSSTGSPAGSPTGGSTGGSTVPAVAPPTAARLAFGVNMHTASATTNGQVASVLATRNLKVVRIDFMGGNITGLRDLITRVNANGGRVQLVTQPSYQWDNSCNQDLPAVYADAYNQTYSMVAGVKDIAHQFEILNEIQLRSDITSQVAWNSQGSSTAAYHASSCASTLASVAKGMADAIHAHGQQAILGEVGRDWGFLTYMQEKGVTWDITGFHNYPRYGDSVLSTDAWYGTNGPLSQLARFGKPITLNEFNCGETYDSNFENTAGQPDTETCFRSMNKHLADLTTQTVAKLDSIVLYEMTDEPAKAAPENRFGLMVDLNTPKASLFIATAYAGGTLSSAEQAQITSRGLLTDGQIAGMK